MLYLYYKEARKGRRDPPLIEIIGFLLLYPVVALHPETSRIIRFQVGIRWCGPPIPKIARKVTVEDHQRVTGVGMLVKTLG